MSSAGTIVPRYGSTSSGCSAAATPSALTITPSPLASPASEFPSTWVSETPSPGVGIPVDLGQRDTLAGRLEQPLRNGQFRIRGRGTEARQIERAEVGELP